MSLTGKNMHSTEALRIVEDRLCIALQEAVRGFLGLYDHPATDERARKMYALVTELQYEVSKNEIKERER